MFRSTPLLTNPDSVNQADLMDANGALWESTYDCAIGSVCLTSVGNVDGTEWQLTGRLKNTCIICKQ